MKRTRMTTFHSNPTTAFDGLAAAMKEHRAAIDARLERILPPADAAPAAIHQAMRHAVFAGGKRLRPILALMTCEMCGGDAALAMPAACALEMIHTYSLVHDDLPAMDNDDFRRGNPTCHKVFGEAIAILAGDALLTHAFEVLAKEPANSAAVIAEIATAAGTQGMIGGQVMDINSEDLPPDADLVRSIHECKTAALIRQAVRTGAIIAGANAQDLASASDYGEKIGLAYQVVDDMLDREATTEQLGKTAGKDAESGKQTYPAVFGLEASHKKAEELIEQARHSLAPFGNNARHLCALAEFIVARKS
jgi:geranylgeranyl diphosphate synthase type II